MKGSNSIKDVLPAILSESEFLQSTFSKPDYGTHACRSLNFKNHTWIQNNINGNIENPYSTLEPLFPELSEINETMLSERFFKASNIAKGGEAMMAYAALQFSEMSEVERQRIETALLNYCELDTFAMGLILMYWLDKSSS